MVRTLVGTREFVVTVNAYIGGRSQQLQMVNQMTFMEAADYSVSAVGYFKFAILDHADWDAVEIEIGNTNGTVELTEIRRSTD